MLFRHLNVIVQYLRMNASSINLIKKAIAAICCILLLFSSPAIALAENNIVVEQKAEQIENHFHDGDPIGNFAAGSIIGGLLGGGGSVAAVSSAGSVAGLSAAGISSGLATLGSVVGGGMAAGLVVSTALPILGAAGIGFAAYEGFNLIHSKQSKKSEKIIHQ